MANWGLSRQINNNNNNNKCQSVIIVVIAKIKFKQFFPSFIFFCQTPQQALLNSAQTEGE
jgi:hypothetical protein